MQPYSRLGGSITEPWAEAVVGAMAISTACVSAATGKASLAAAPRKEVLVIKYPSFSGLFFAFP
ncbi:hypothetical protein D3C71_2159820 [compost metagenome]